MAIKPKNSVELKAAAHCPSHSLAEISIRDLTFSIDEPTERGGSNKGPASTDTVLSAFVGFTNVIGHKCAEKLKADIGHLQFDVNYDFDRRGVMLSEEIDVPFTKIELNVKSDGSATADELQSVAAEVGKYCPLAKLFRQAGTVIPLQ